MNYIHNLNGQVKKGDFQDQSDFKITCDLWRNIGIQRISSNSTDTIWLCQSSRGNTFGRRQWSVVIIIAHQYFWGHLISTVLLEASQVMQLFDTWMKLKCINDVANIIPNNFFPRISYGVSKHNRFSHYR